MQASAPLCEPAFQASCVDAFLAMGCGATDAFCAAEP
jgi:hypothetical protein